jgi:hypothetical protein
MCAVYADGGSTGSGSTPSQMLGNGAGSAGVEPLALWISAPKSERKDPHTPPYPERWQLARSIQFRTVCWLSLRMPLTSATVRYSSGSVLATSGGVSDPTTPVGCSSECEPARWEALWVAAEEAVQFGERLEVLRSAFGAF